MTGTSRSRGAAALVIVRTAAGVGLGLRRALPSDPMVARHRCGSCVLLCTLVYSWVEKDRSISPLRFVFVTVRQPAGRTGCGYWGSLYWSPGIMCVIRLLVWRSGTQRDCV